jgi:hypothetical protein
MTATRKLGIRAPDTESSPASPSEPTFSVRSDVGSSRTSETESRPDRNFSDRTDAPQSAISPRHEDKTPSRPPFSSPEFLPYFTVVVKTSKTAAEAVRRLGYAHPSVVYYHLKRFGIERPPQWNKRPWLREIMQGKIPAVIIPTTVGRCWVAGLVLGEGCIQSIYRDVMDATYLRLDLAMVDSAPIFKLSEFYGLPQPTKPIRNHDWRPQWRKNVQGLRALRVLHEILPFLVGQKLKEAEKALSFFGPRGNHRGCYRNGDVWPQSEFPLRTKRRGSNTSSTHEVAAERMTGHLSGWSSQPSAGLSKRPKIPAMVIPTLEDRSWTGGLTQGEGSIESHYMKSVDFTTVVFSVSMTDSAPVLRFSDLVGLPKPSKPKPNTNSMYKAAWRKEVTGLRALKVLREIQPFLLGEKLREAEKALSFFSPNGYRLGHFRPADIWPRDEYPLRKR